MQANVKKENIFAEDVRSGGGYSFLVNQYSEDSGARGFRTRKVDLIINKTAYHTLFSKVLRA